jgi:hypothetical protein
MGEPTADMSARVEGMVAAVEEGGVAVAVAVVELVAPDPALPSRRLDVQ